MQKRLYTKGFYTHKTTAIKKPETITENFKLKVEDSKIKTQDSKLVTSNSKFIIVNSKLTDACDTLVLKSGAKLTVSIKDASSTDIKYKACPTTNDSYLSIKKTDVSQIHYGNGRKEIFEEEPNYNQPQNLPLGSDIVSYKKKDRDQFKKQTNTFAIAGFVVTFVPYPFALVCLFLILFTSSLSGSSINTGGFNGKNIGIGWYTLLFAFAIIALILCIIALKKIKKTGGTEKGKGIAVLGIILSLLLIISLIAIYSTIIV